MKGIKFGSFRMFGDSDNIFLYLPESAPFGGQGEKRSTLGVEKIYFVSRKSGIKY